MRPLVTASIVADELAEVYLRLPNHAGMKARPRETCQAYFADLRDLSAESFRAACLRVRREDVYFPKVSTLRRYAQEWTQRNPESSALGGSGDDGHCPRCHQPWRDERRWRPMVDTARQNRLVTELRDDRVVVRLEQMPFGRLCCDCSPAPEFAPDPELGEPPAVVPKPGSYLDRRAALARPRAAVQPA